MKGPHTWVLGVGLGWGWPGSPVLPGKASDTRDPQSGFTLGLFQTHGRQHLLGKPTIDQERAPEASCPISGDLPLEVLRSDADCSVVRHVFQVKGLFLGGPLFQVGELCFGHSLPRFNVADGFIHNEGNLTILARVLDTQRVFG